MLSKTEGQLQCRRTAGAQCMTQHYAMVVDRDGVIEKEPYFVRGEILTRQTADFLLEGILTEFPCRLEDADAMAVMSIGCDTLWVALSYDRVSANWVVVVTIFDMLDRPGMPQNILCHGEPCSLHGLSLVERAPLGGRNITKRLVSFTLWTKFWKHLAAPILI